MTYLIFITISVVNTTINGNLFKIKIYTSLILFINKHINMIKYKFIISIINFSDNNLIFG